MFEVRDAGQAGFVTRLSANSERSASVSFQPRQASVMETP
jgi:hypothetical protein